MVLNYCPTVSMVSDYLSKPIQGSLFRVHRNTLMGITEQDLKQFKIECEEAIILILNFLKLVESSLYHTF